MDNAVDFAPYSFKNYYRKNFKYARNDSCGVIEMTSLEKMKYLIELEKRGSAVKVVTIKGDEHICILNGIAEDEEDWAYHFITVNNPTNRFILECDYIKSIEELT